MESSANSIRAAAVTIGLVVALLVAYSLGSTGSDVAGASTTPEEAPENAGEIVMTGSGEATGVPDQLAFRLSVNTKADDVSTAMAQANATMRDVLRALTEEGVARKDVQTTGLDISPDYDYSGTGPATITGYRVSQDLGVLVRSLPDAGAVISAAVGAGGNAIRLHDLRLKVGDEEALVREARDAAVAEATAKAEQYAAATGQQLGDVLSIKEVSVDRGPVPVLENAARDMRAFSKVPIRAGRAESTVRVSVTWALAS